MEQMKRDNEGDTRGYFSLQLPTHFFVLLDKEQSNQCAQTKKASSQFLFFVRNCHQKGQPKQRLAKTGQIKSFPARNPVPQPRCWLAGALHFESHYKPNSWLFRIWHGQLTKWNVYYRKTEGLGQEFRHPQHPSSKHGSLLYTRERFVSLPLLSKHVHGFVYVLL